MVTRSRKAIRSAAVVGAALFAALGCGGPDGPKTYPVKGKVVYKGGGDVGRLTGGQVHFESVGETRVTGLGEIEDGGTFSVWCYLESKDREGLPPGEYRVCVRTARGGGDEDGAPRRRSGPIHPRYQTFDKSGLTVTVAEGTNTPTIEVEAAK
jgi:hypothetical protein